MVVFFGGISLIFPQYNSSIGFIGYVRNVRLLRPLRTINRIKGLRILVNSLIDSIPYIANVAIFLLFILLIFSIFGLHLFAGIFENRCRLTSEPVDGEWPILEGYNNLCNLELNNCPEGSFCGAPIDYGLIWDKSEIDNEEFNFGITNFDQIQNSVLTTLQTITGEGWSSQMYTLWHSFD